MPRISVIIPVYNVEHYLNRCIESVISQSFSDFELILVDDGTPDNSGKMCDSWAEKDERIKVIHKSNAGLSSARNAGLEIAVGEYVTFIDSDDLVHPDYLKILYESCIGNNTEITIGYFTRFSKISEIEYISGNELRSCVISSTQALLNLYDWNVLPYFNSSCGKLYKRDLFADIRFPVGRLFEDEFVTYLLYSKCYSISVIESPLYYYFVNEKSITNTLSLEKYFDEHDAQIERIEYYRNKKMIDVYDVALLFFLKETMRNYIECQKRDNVDVARKSKFISDFNMVFENARKRNLLDFLKHYDYYVVTHPERVPYYRVMRQIRKRIKR